jgi:YegS/Rv2252/BmrU family lipid kinase
MSGKKQQRSVRACLIVSARSGRHTFDLEAATAVLSKQQWDVAVRAKEKKGEAVDLAREAAEDGFDLVVNCGGDGTLNEIVEALAGTSVAIGVIPGGTENVWSKEVGISSRSDVAATQLLTGVRARVDVGIVRIDGERDRHFLMMAGLGADGAVMARVSRSLKQRLGPVAVGVAAVQALPELRRTPIEVRLDGVPWSGSAAEVVIGNTRRYGGFTRVTDGAYIDDGLLDVCIFTTGGVVDVGRQLAALFMRQRPSVASAEQYRVSQVEIRAPSSMALQIDGSPMEEKTARSETEYRFSVMPRALTVIVPRTYDGELFRFGLSKRERKKGKKRKKDE